MYRIFVGKSDGQSVLELHRSKQEEKTLPKEGEFMTL
jgi:hypothetical protein